MLHGNLTAIIKFGQQKSLWLIEFSPSFGNDSDDEVATEQLTVVVFVRVDVTFMPHDDPEISYWPNQFLRPCKYMYMLANQYDQIFHAFKLCLISLAS